MTIPEALLPKFEDQITLEFASSLVYRQLAIVADAQDLSGMATWLRRQADEEIAHANRFIDHCVDRDATPALGAIPAPEVPAGVSPLEIFQTALAHEKRVSESIRDLYRVADAEGDFDSRPILNFFVEEQLAEVATVSEIVGQIERIGDDGPGILRLDIELGQRPQAPTEA